MRINNYLSVLMCQLNMTLDCNASDEYLIETDSIEEQICKAFKIAEIKQPDITLFPEMSYIGRFEEKYKFISKRGNLAYYIARDENLKDNLFGIFAICSNSNTHVFEEETAVIHNHNESIYSFVLNCVSTYKGKKYGDGQSYIYGPISVHEKEWLKKEGINTKVNPTHILSLSEIQQQYVYGEFIFPEQLSIYGRSDKYINNPRSLFVSNE